MKSRGLAAASPERIPTTVAQSAFVAAEAAERAAERAAAAATRAEAPASPPSPAGAGPFGGNIIIEQAPTPPRRPSSVTLSLPVLIGIVVGAMLLALLIANVVELARTRQAVGRLALAMRMIDARHAARTEVAADDRGSLFG